MARTPYSLLVRCPVCSAQPYVRCFYTDGPYEGQPKRMAHKKRTYLARARGLG